MFITFFIRTPNQATVLTGFVGIAWALSLWAPFALISAEISKRDSDARREGIRNRGRNNNIQGEGGVVGRHEDQAGVILGLHNVAVSAPQIVATLVSSLIFKLAQKPRGVPYDDSVGWVLRFGGLAALAAAFFIWRIDEEAEVAKTYHKIGKGIADGDSAEEGQRLRNEEAV
jgi:solute carrier family 45 protein 1/2/4